ncbi:hypothetical protein CYMTET_18347 [Cymbomonas tetramitiformis]|uniref:EGF-like domain-containing protein n=1 Tax=Cymbomonas tetramitiformis TaxID=36881 RepID=A0AAE0L696_9CHLO|nr:hypothetical protein CYMTET_18347 [Cymbomonas tetramitiformis]
MDDFSADVEAEVVSLLAEAARVSTSQVIMVSVTNSTQRRQRQLRQSGTSTVTVLVDVSWYENDLAVVNASNVRRPGARGRVHHPRDVIRWHHRATGYPPPNPPLPPPPPACEVYDPCFAYGDRAAECVNVGITENSTEGWMCLDCPEGFDGNGTHCDDVDECLRGNGGCDNRTSCANAYGTRVCGPCPEGFTGNGAPEAGGCIDTDECTTANGGCDFMAVCHNTPGGFYCGACPAGFSGTGDTECVDINECLDAAACDELTICSNSAGGYACTACPPGYSGTGKTGCRFASSCEEAPCDPLTQCSVVNGRVTCSECPTGYSGSGFVGCEEVDGCAVTASAPNGPCFPGVQCTDVPAPGLGFACGPCPEGYIGEYGIGELGCKLDLCPLGSACSLDPKVTCTMVTATAFSCGLCPSGYSGDGYVRGAFPGCEDVDECAINNPCDPRAECINLRGGVECGPCPEGFVGTGSSGCQETTGSCDEGNGGCWTNGEVSAECRDTDPDTGAQLVSPVCGTCPAGMEDQEGAQPGTACVDIDRCAAAPGELSQCAEGVTCLDLRAPADGFNCAECSLGLIGDGYNPERYPEKEGCYLDACFSSNGGCSTNPAVACTNVRDALNGRVCGPGCPTGYTDVWGDATLCEDEKSCELYPCFSSVEVDPPVAVQCTDLPAPAAGPTGRVCAACPNGFEGDGAECTDVDECLVANGGCYEDYSAEPTPVVTTCTNTLMDKAHPLGRQCGPCPDGYKGSGDTECIYVERCGVGDSTATNGGCWVGQELYAGLSTTCTDLPNLGGTECGPCPEGMSSPDGTGATGCVEVDACISEPCYDARVTCTDYKAYEDPPTGRLCTYVAHDPKVGDTVELDWTCPEGFKGDGVQCVECAMLVRITNATIVDGATNRAGWQLNKRVQVYGQLTGLDSAACTNLQGTYFRWAGSVSDGSELVLGDANMADTWTLTIFKEQLKVKRNYIVSFQGFLRGNQAITGSADLPFFVNSLPIAVSMSGGNVVTGDRSAVVLNASATSDPDGAEGEIEYSWRCRIQDSVEKCRERSELYPEGVALPTSLRDPALNLSLLGGVGEPINYTFTLTASKGERSSVHTTKLSIFQGGAPVPSIAALVCSQPPCKANPVEKLTLRAAVQSDDPGYLTTEWLVEAEDAEDAFEIDDSTCLTSKFNRDLVVRAGVLRERAVYTFTLLAQDRIGPSSASISVTVNSPPRPGTLAVSPTEGTELETLFRFSAVGWSDDDKPLRYRLHYMVPGDPGSTSGEGAYQALGADYNPNFEQSTMLPQAGLEAPLHRVTVRLSVIDNFDAVSTFAINVTLRPQEVLVTDDVLKAAVTSSLSGDTDSVMTQVLGTSKALVEHTAYDSDSDSDSDTDNATGAESDYDYGGGFVMGARRRVLLSANGTTTNGTVGATSEGNVTGQKLAQVTLMVDLMGTALGSSLRTADSGAAMSGVLGSVLVDPEQITEDTQSSALGMYGTLSTGTAVPASLADSVCGGLSSLNQAKEPVLARRRRQLLQAGDSDVSDAELEAKAAARGAEVVAVLSGLGGSMLQGAVADEEPVATHSPSLAMKVGVTRADLPDSTLYAAPVTTGDGSPNGVQFPSSMGASVVAAAAARRRRSLLQLEDSDNGTSLLAEEEVLPEQEVSMRVLTTTSETHSSNVSSPEYEASGAAALHSASGVQQVVLGVGDEELDVSDLEVAIEIVMELKPEQVASRRRRLLAEEAVGRLECRFWSAAKEAYDTEGCVTLPNPAPPGAQLYWRTKNVTAAGNLSLTWGVGNGTLTSGCEERFDAALDEAVWAGTDAGRRKWVAPAGVDGAYVAHARVPSGGQQ